MADSGRPSVRGLHLAVLGVVGLFLLMTFLPTWQIVFRRWVELPETDAHGFLVVAVSLYLLIETAWRARIPADDDRRRTFLVLAFLGSVVWCLASIANVLLIEALVLPAVFFAVVCAGLGYRASRQYAFAIGYLYFALPVWGGVQMVLQWLTIEVNDAVLMYLGVPALIDGAIVHLPVGTFHIAAGCAGLHYFVVAFALSSLYAYLFLHQTRYRIVTVLAALIAAVIVNWARVVTIIYAGYVTDMEHFLVAVDHYYFGWFLFALALVPIFFVFRYIERREARATSSGDVQGSGADQVAAGGSRKVSVSVAMALIAVAALPAATMAVQGVGNAGDSDGISLPVAIDGWVERLDPVPWTPRYPGAQAEVIRLYAKGDAYLCVYLNRYTRQEQGRELLGAGSWLFDQTTSRLVDRRSRHVATLNGSEEPLLLETRVSTMGQKSVTGYWYWVGDKRMVRGIDIKFQQLVGFFRGQSGAGIVAVSMNCTDDCQKEEEALVEFLAASGHQLEAAGKSSASGAVLADLD